LKAAAAEAVIATVRPVQQRLAELSSDPAEVDRLIARGAERAQEVASEVLARAYAAAGLLPRS
jgi:tryptophanyl-tRNA synthetase